MVHPDARESMLCRQTVSNSADRDVVIDASGIAVLSVLPAEIREAAVAVFRRAITTEEIARDARQCAEDLSRRSGTLYYNAETDGPGLTEPTDEEAAVFRKRLASLQSVIGKLQRETIQPNAAFRRVRLNVHASVMQVGVSKRIAVWCDDTAARLMMRNFGMPTFSTFAVLEHLLAQGIVTATQHEDVLDTLVRERIGNPAVDLSRTIRIARQEDWQAASAAACLTQSQAWTDIAGTSELARKVLLTCQREQPQQVAAWTNAAVFGAVLNCPNAKAAVQIGSLILAANLLSLFASGELARDMVFATRAAVKAAMPVDNPANIATDPLPIAAEHMRTLLLGNTGITPDQVFPRILEFFSELGDRDRQLVAEAILAKDRR